ncbi:MAG: heme exporter protein CcmB [Kofleriaceae bacterium]|nr:heme exporter protein CcmB [Myxococcales bacterium]MCB9572417.1 heme exporter protein CcmB [Kofleriaceae bacterium]
MSFFRHVGAVAWKDLRVELRSREIVYTMAFFAALLVVVFSFALSQDGETIAAVAPGIVWTSVALAGTIGLGRAFDREREGDTMRALLLTPASRLGVFLGKALGIAVLILLVDVVVVPLVVIMFDAPLFDHVLPLAVLLAIGAIGFALVGTVFAAMLLRVRSRDVLLPIVLYPILMPLFIAGTKGTGALIAARPDLGAAWYWIEFLSLFDAAVLVASLWTFESLVIE